MAEEAQPETRGGGTEDVGHSTVREEHIFGDVGDRGRRRSQEWGEWITFMGSLNILKHPIAINSLDMMGKSFATAEEAKTFFDLYARLTGFSVRKGTKRIRPNGDLKCVTWLCSKEGFRHKRHLMVLNRQREPRSITRTGCKVRIRVLQNKQSRRWVVREFISVHNHDVANGKESAFLKSHRNVPQGAFEMAKSMQDAGMKVCHIIAYLIDQNGGIENSTFLPKDMRNKLCAAENEVADADAARAIGYLQHKADLDMGLFAKYTVDNTRRLGNMVWADSSSRRDYEAFGHVVAFDSTYRTNKFRKPLLIFVGVNNHFRSVVFGFAMLTDESFETYKWVLETFVECMNGVKPTGVITDGDLAMKRAISEVFPNAVHRMCTWHIEHNAMSNVKEPLFFSWLQRLMFKYFEEPAFEEEWKKMVIELSLSNNSWLPQLYAKRVHWAETYLRGKYFAGMTTTQRNEGINAAMKKKVSPTMPLHQWVRHLDMAVASLRHNELKDNFDAKNGMPVVNITNMPLIEKQAAELFSRTIFFKIRDEICREGKYMVDNDRVDGTTHFVTLSKYAMPGQTRLITYNAVDLKFDCVCNKFNSTGIPCRHVFAVMKYLHMTRLPSTLICKHWMKTTRDKAISSSEPAPHFGDPHDQHRLRFNEISAMCGDIAWFGSQSDRIYKLTKKKVEDILVELRDLFENNIDPSNNEDLEDNEYPDVRNPNPSQTKGSASSPSGKTRKKRCGYCKERGHNIQTCATRRMQRRRDKEEQKTTMFDDFHTQTSQNVRNDSDKGQCSFQSPHAVDGQPIKMDDDSTATATTPDWYGFPYGGGDSKLWE